MWEGGGGRDLEWVWGERLDEVGRMRYLYFEGVGVVFGNIWWMWVLGAG